MNIPPNYGKPVHGGWNQSGTRTVNRQWEQRRTDGTLMLEGASADGHWLRLTFLPTRQALLYEHSGRGPEGIKLHCRDVTIAAWDAIKRSPTLAAWQAAVARLVDDARAERRAVAVVPDGVHVSPTGRGQGAGSVMML